MTLGNGIVMEPVAYMARGGMLVAKVSAVAEKAGKDSVHAVSGPVCGDSVRGGDAGKEVPEALAVGAGGR